MQNESKPTSSVSNSAKVSVGETWGTITTTWASETRTWGEVSKLIDNTVRPQSGTSYLLKQDGYKLLLQDGGRIIIGIGGAIINQPKP